MSTPWIDGQPKVAFGKTYADNPWDTMFIGGSQTPGLCNVAVNAARRVDEKKHAGADGETLSIHGRNLARVIVKIRTWTKEQHERMELILSKVWANYGQTGSAGQATGPITGSVSGGLFPAAAAAIAASPLLSGIPASLPADTLAFDAAHPKLSLHGVKAITVIDVDGPEQGTGAEWAVLTWTLKCLQYAPANKKISKPATASKPVATTQNLQQLNTANGVNSNQNQQPKNAPAPDPSTNTQDTGPNFTPASGQSGAF